MCLLEAVKANKITKVQELVAGDVNQNEASWALHYAVNRGYIEIVRILISAGTDTNRKLFIGDKCQPILVEGSVLRDAALEGYLEIVEELLKAGANVNYVPSNSDEASALMLAAQEGHFDIVKKLVEAGADVNVVKDRSSYALLSAASNGYKEIFDFLYPLTDPELRSEALEILPEGMQMRQIEEEADPLVCELTDSIIQNDIDRVRELISTSLDINSYDEIGSTPLIFAVVKRSIKLVKTMLEAGANPNMKDIDKRQTPLIKSTAFIWSEDDIIIASLLLKAGCDVNAQDREGFTAIMHAITYTPRNDESRAARLKCTQMLLEYGADISIKNCDNQNVLDLVLSDNSELLHLLKKR